MRLLAGADLDRVTDLDRVDQMGVDRVGDEALGLRADRSQLVVQPPARAGAGGEQGQRRGRAGREPAPAVAAAGRGDAGTGRDRRRHRTVQQRAVDPGDLGGLALVAAGARRLLGMAARKAWTAAQRSASSSPSRWACSSASLIQSPSPVTAPS